MTKPPAKQDKRSKNPTQKPGVSVTTTPRQWVPGNPGNSGGKPGRSGRKPLEFVQECQRLSNEEIIPKIAAKLANADVDDAAWQWAAEYVAKHGLPKQVQPIALDVRHAVVVLPSPDKP